ncbi:MAG: arylsulfatase A-like enzyme [Candidatus Paceibacteria bacterium]|jgi:arylsulfatase A-like enzyme
MSSCRHHRARCARSLTWLLPVALPLGSLLGGCGAVDSSADSSEVVALVIIDTLRRDSLGCYGSETAATPVIDGLAAEGARFEQAISASGWTLPSVASIFTGTWPAMHKALGKRSRLTPISNDLPVAAEVFADEGYLTLGFANAAFLSPLLGLDRGFEIFDHKHAYNWDIRRADATVDTALAKLDEHTGKKAFLLVHLFDAHLDYDPPDGFISPFVGTRNTPDVPVSMKECIDLQREEGSLPPTSGDIDYLRGLYDGEIAFIDRAMGRLVDGLKELGRWDQTTLVITSDHGEEFWDHGGFEHGHTLYDELVRVPLIIRVPDGAKLTTHVVERQVRTIDIMPTLFDLAGITQGPTFIGQSLAGDLRGQSPLRVPPAFSQGTLYGAEKMSWRNGGYNLIVDQAVEGEPGIELYDLTVDPLQQHDISKEQPERTQKLSRQLATFSRKLGEQAKHISTPELRDMGPSTIQKYLESIEKLGYSGRDSETKPE